MVHRVCRVGARPTFFSRSQDLAVGTKRTGGGPGKELVKNVWGSGHPVVVDAVQGHHTHPHRARSVGQPPLARRNGDGLDTTATVIGANDIHDPNIYFRGGGEGG